MRRTVLLLALAFSASSLGCAPEGALDKGPEADVPGDLSTLEGAADSFRRPVDHGALVLGQTVSSTFSSTAIYHAWTFELAAPATVTLRTSSPAATAPDTVLYLYRETAGSWGSYIARNDDAPGTKLSRLSSSLVAGRYRVIVKGYDRSVSGPFGLVSECTGAGCPGPVMPPAAACLFGATFGDILAGSVRIALDDRITVIDSTIPAFLRAQIVAAVHESVHTDVTTAEQALAVVDGHEIRRLRVWEEASGRAFTAIEYGVGDNSYGAIFADNTTTRVAAIHDGDLVSCTAAPASCRLGTSYHALAASTAFDVVSSTTVTATTTLTTAQRAQVLAAVRLVYPAARDLASAIAMVDGQQVNRLELTERATRTRVVAIEFGAGDNSYGAVFSGSTTTIVARIVDGDLAGCTLLGAP